MLKQTNGKHHLERFDSLAEIVAYSRTLEDHRSDNMTDGRTEFWGKGKYRARSLEDLYALADTGMAREGIEALAIAHDRVKTLNRELAEQQFTSFYDVTGADVDVSRYLAGEQECMSDWSTSEVLNHTPIVTLVTNICVNCDITADAFTQQGQALVAVAEAIDSTGLQSEIWADCTISERRGHTGRFSIRLKSGNGPFDPGAFMFVLTHPAFFRGLLLNAMHAWPEKFREAMSVGITYGHSASGFEHKEDYPESSVFIPAIQNNRDAGQFVTKVLRQLGLLGA